MAVVSEPDIFMKAQQAFFGYGREQNYKEAKELYEESERRGIVEASNCLGKMYLNGDGVVREYEKAWRHFLISGE